MFLQYFAAQCISSVAIQVHRILFNKIPPHLLFLSQELAILTLWWEIISLSAVMPNPTMCESYTTELFCMLYLKEDNAVVICKRK